MDLEEALAQADVYAEETEVCTIDNDLRTITIPSGLQTVGVESDEDVRRLNFQMPKQYGEVDLSAFDVRVNYLNANKEGDVYVVTDKEVSGDHMTFSWLLSRNAMAYKGTIRFIVCLKKTDDEGVTQQEFNTTIAQLTVLEGLETTEKMIQENKDLIEAILKQLDDVSGAEAKRQQAETERASAEAKRQQAETERASAESERQKQEQERQQAIVQVTNTANEAQNTANQAQTTVTEMEKDVLKLKTEMNSAQTDIQQAQQAAQTADEKAETAQAAVDALAVRVTEAETNILQNAEAVEINASKTEEIETNLANNYYSKTETDAKIKVESDRITSTVKSEMTTEIAHKIDEIEVGGRNYIIGGKGDNQTGFFSDSDIGINAEEDEPFARVGLQQTNPGGYPNVDISNGFAINIEDYVFGDAYTWSFDARVVEYTKPEGAVISEFWMGQRYGKPSWISMNTVRMSMLTTAKVGEWIHYTITNTISKKHPDDTAGGIQESIQCHWTGLNENETCKFVFDIKNVKLEKGNKATDWTPAPEDINQGINNAQSSADAAQTGLTALQARVKTAEEAIVSVQTDVETAQTTANTAKTNAATAQSTANTAKTNASNAQTTANTAVQAAADAQEDIDVLLSIIKKNASGQVEFNWTSARLGGRVCKLLWSGKFSSGSITIPDLPYYNILLVKSYGFAATAILCREAQTSGLGNDFRGGVLNPYNHSGGSRAMEIFGFSLTSSGTTLTLRKAHKFAIYDDGGNPANKADCAIDVIYGVI